MKKVFLMFALLLFSTLVVAHSPPIVVELDNEMNKECVLDVDQNIEIDVIIGQTALTWDAGTSVIKGPEITLTSNIIEVSDIYNVEALEHRYWQDVSHVSYTELVLQSTEIPLTLFLVRGNQLERGPGITSFYHQSVRA